MKKYIRTAQEPSPKEEVLKDDIDQLKDDFDYAMSGIEKIAADGDVDKASEIVRSLSEMINASDEEIAENIASEE